MPFTSQRQRRAAFGGHIPGLSGRKAHEWAHETSNLKDLPERAPGEKGKKTLRPGVKPKTASHDPRLVHFAKLAQMMGMGGSAASIGGISGATAPTSAFDAPQMAQAARGAGDFSPKIKKFKTSKQQAINPRLRVVDAMNKVVG